MNVFIKNVMMLDQGYQEILIDQNNFQPVRYKSLVKQSLSIHGIMFNNIYILEPLNYYKIILKEDVQSFEKFTPVSRLLEAGLIFSDIDKTTMSFFVYNCTHNHIYIKADVKIGEIE